MATDHRCQFQDKMTSGIGGTMVPKGLYDHRSPDDKFFGRIRDLSKDRVIRKRGVDESTHCNSGDQRCDTGVFSQEKTRLICDESVETGKSRPPTLRFVPPSAP
jgi:hypothetical protein